MINSALNPMPLRYVPLPPPMPEAGPSAPTVSQEARPFAEPQPHEPTNQAGVRRKRNLQASHVLERRLFSFKLFHCKETQENISAMTEVDTVNTIFYVLLLYEKNGKGKIEAKEINIGQRVNSLVMEEIYENLDKSNLSMEQQFERNWNIELWRRNETMKTERKPASQSRVRRKRNLQGSHVVERTVFPLSSFNAEKLGKTAITKVGTVNRTINVLLSYEKNGKKKI